MKKHLLAFMAIGALGAGYAFADDPEFTEITKEFNPEIGTVMTELSQFDITFSVPMTIDSPADVSVLRDGVNTNATVSCTLSDDAKTVTYFISPAQTEAGKYTFENLDWATYPERYEDGATPFLNELYYIVESGSGEQPAEVSIIFNPANESQLEELSSFTMTFNMPIEIDWPESVEVKRNGVVVCGIDAKIGDDGHTATITLEKPQTEQGTYTFNHLDWAVCPTDLTIATPEFELVYYIGEPQELEPIVTYSPENGRVLTSIQEVLLMFENVKVIEVNPEVKVTMSNGTTTYDYYLTNEYPAYKQVLASPVDENLSITEEGTWTLTVPEGAITLDGKPFSASPSYVIEEPFRLLFSNPEPGIVTPDELEKIDLTFNREIVSITGYMLQGLTLRLLGEDDMPIRVVASYDATIDPDNRKVVHLTAIDGVDIEEDGVYSLNLPPTLFKSENASNLAQVIDFVVDRTGITSVAAERNMKVYNLQGVEVSAANLPAGIYIMGGKKVIVR